jgi:hypothetical protein
MVLNSKNGLWRFAVWWRHGQPPRPLRAPPAPGTRLRPWKLTPAPNKTRCVNVCKIAGGSKSVLVLGHWLGGPACQPPSGQIMPREQHKRPMKTVTPVTVRSKHKPTLFISDPDRPCPDLGIYDSVKLARQKGCFAFTGSGSTRALGITHYDGHHF